MDWKELAGPLIRLGAPTLGALVAGPLGEAVGNALARAVGAEATPEAVGGVLASDTRAPAVLADLEADWVKVASEVGKAQVAETGATARAELASGDRLQRWWRPLYALELTLECAALWAVIVHEFWTGDIGTINALVAATGLLVAYWGLRFAVLGVYVSGRTREKEATVTGESVPRVLESLVKAVRNK